MPKKTSINQAKYDAVNCKNYHFKLVYKTDSDIIEKLSSVPSMQGYIKQLIRQDIAKSAPNSAPEIEMEEGKMNNKFYGRVLREGIVDTKQYRYAVKECNDANHQWLEIQRLPIECLDTTEAIDGWKTVKVYD